MMEETDLGDTQDRKTDQDRLEKKPSEILEAPFEEKSVSSRGEPVIVEQN